MIQARKLTLNICSKMPNWWREALMSLLAYSVMASAAAQNDEVSWLPLERRQRQSQLQEQGGRVAGGRFPRPTVIEMEEIVAFHFDRLLVSAAGVLKVVQLAEGHRKVHVTG